MSNNRINDQGNIFLESITDFDNVSTSKMVQSNCMSITFINKGDTVVTVNSLELAVNEKIEIVQLSAFIDRTQYQVSFASGGVNNNCVVIRTLPKNQS
jgi:aerobic-type carbon monoxide dehydrogenase small subunit (CoxS/CutS family)